MAIFPEEVLEQICYNIRQFHNEFRYQTLFNVMLCSRALYRIAHDMLYHSMNSKHAFMRLLQSSAKRSDVLELVEESKIRYWRRKHCSKLQLDQSLFESLLVSAGCTDVSWELRNDLQDALHKGDKEANICMLFAACRNLKVFIFEEPQGLMGTLLLRFITEARHFKGPLSHLTMLQTEGMDTMHRDYIEHVLPYWQLPSLRSYRGEFMECINDPFPVTETSSKQPSSYLSHLVLQDSLIDSIGLESILTFCPHLRSLDIEPGDPRWTEFKFEWYEFGEVLNRHGTGLEYFMLDTMFFYECGEGPSETVLGNLRDMKKLRSLLLDWVSVIGPTGSTAAETVLSQPNYLAETLPTGLHELVLTMDEEPRDLPEQEDLQLIELMESERFENLNLILILKRNTFLHSLPHGWKQSLGGEHMRLEWGITVGTRWQGRVVETEGGLVLERI